MIAKHLLIKGKVQGVFYRVSAKETADALNITGWVKNTPDGHVEALACGPADKVHAFIEWCRKGPSRAVVNEVIINEAAHEAFEQFRIIR